MPNLLTRKQVRLKEYDYSQNGAYFVTICTYNRQDLFANICRGTISCAPNKGGNIARKYWEEIPRHYPYVDLDEFIVMPNHIHGILLINNWVENIGKRAQNFVPLRNNYQKIIPGSLSAIIRGYKIGVTKWFRENTKIKTVWQRSFYDRVIRDNRELNDTREYIQDNPLKWESDKENPENMPVFEKDGKNSFLC